MAFTAPADELVQQPGAQGGGFTAPQDEIISPDYWGDVKKNAVAGLKQFPAAAKASVNQATDIMGGLMPGALGESAGDALSGVPLAETPMGKSLQATYGAGKGLVQGAWQGLKDTGSVVKAPFQMLGGDDLAQTDIGQKFRQRPLSVPIGVAGTVGMGLQGLKALRGAPEAAPAPEVPPAEPPGAPGTTSDLYISPLHGYSGAIADSMKQIQDPAHGAWIGDLEKSPGVISVKGGQIGTLKNSDTGEVSSEPSAIVTVSKADAEQVASRLGQGIARPGSQFGAPQDGVLMVDEHSGAPNGTSHKLIFNSPEALSEWHGKMTEKGLDSTLDLSDNSATLHDRDNARAADIWNVVSDAKKAGDLNDHGFIKTGIELRKAADYQRGSAGTPDEIGSSNEAPDQGGRSPPNPSGPASTEAAGVNPPPPGAAPPPSDLLKTVSDYVSQKFGPKAAEPGFIPRMGGLLEDESLKFGGKDLGFQPRQVASMGPGFEGLDKAKALINYGRGEGLLKNGLTDIARRAKIKDVIQSDGQQLGSYRSLGDSRGAPPIGQIREALKSSLLDQFGIDAPSEINKVMAKFEKAPKTFSGMAELATDLNKSKTNMKSLGQHPGPTTEAANIVARMSNDALRKVLTPEEASIYTEKLKRFGAYKKFEQATSASGRRELTARTNQRGIFGRMFQEAMDRVGNRAFGNIAHRMGEGMMKTPAKFNTLPKFFEEFAHHAGDAMDETVEGMAHGGIVQEMGGHLEEKYGARKG